MVFKSNRPVLQKNVIYHHGRKKFTHVLRNREGKRWLLYAWRAILRLVENQMQRPADRPLRMV